MRFAEVAVDAPVGHSRTFSYSVPPQFTVEPGQLVWVPFGRRVAQGLVVELADSPQVEVTRDILQPIEPSPLVSRVNLELAQWLSRYYLCSLFSAIATLLPPGFEAQVRSQVRVNVGTNGATNEGTGPRGTDVELPDPSTLRPQSIDALAALRQAGNLREQEFLKLLGSN